MAVAPVTVTATITDPSGTVLAGNSYVRFRLRNFDGFVPSVAGQAVIVESQLDAVPTAGAISQLLWPNSAISPSSTFYTVEFWNQGRIIYSANYIFNGNTNLNTASPINTPPVPPGFSLVFENNGALNSSQTLLNLESTDGSVTITDEGSGNINLQAVSSVLPGTNIIALPSAGPGGGSTTVLNVGTTNSVVVVVPGRSLQCAPSKWTVTINPSSASVQVVSMNIAQCTQDTGNVVTSVPITFNGGQAAPLLSAGSNTSDSIVLTLSPMYDYFIRLLVSSGGLMNELLPLSGCLPPCTNTVSGAGNVQAANPIVLSSGTNHPGQSLLFNWVSA